MDIINQFLIKHGFYIINDQNLVDEYNKFKVILNKIINKHIENIIIFFGIDKNFDYNFMLNNLNDFNNLLKDINELI